MDANQNPKPLDNSFLLSLIEQFYNNNEDEVDFLKVMNELRFGNSFFFVQTMNQEEEDIRKIITGEERYEFITHVNEGESFQLVFTSEALIRAFLNDPNTTYRQFRTRDVLKLIQTTPINGIIIDVHSDSQLIFYQEEII